MSIYFMGLMRKGRDGQESAQIGIAASVATVMEIWSQLSDDVLRLKSSEMLSFITVTEIEPPRKL